jgi:hypothetical protein
MRSPTSWTRRAWKLGIVTGDGDMVRFRPAQLVARDNDSA